MLFKMRDMYMHVIMNITVYNHGDIILNKSKNLNETRKALPPGFFLKFLNSIFRSINMGVYHRLLLQLFLTGFCLFCSKIGKNKYRDFI